MKQFLTVLLAAISIGAQVAHAENLYGEQFRPQLHFTPPQQWMNDPNGMVYLDGEYHLFYQYHPYGNKWGPMHWGHAVSKDMVQWQNLPIALYPDEHGTIFSGSAVVDRDNTSGLGSKTNPPLIAIFTYHNHLLETQGRNDFQTEGMAYSLDKGRTWTKYADNPVVKNPGLRDFRDPKVSWYAPGRKWIMTLAVADHASFYSSPDLKHWTHESDFGLEWGTHAGVWECPDLIEMKIDGEAMTRHVLLVSVGTGGINGGSATQYFVGDFDGHQFVLDPALRDKLKLSAAEFPAGDLFEDFKGDLSRWSVSGDAFVTGVAGLRSDHNGDAATGRMRSHAFRINKHFINFEIGGGQYPGVLGLQLLVDGKVVRTETGNDGNAREPLRNASWDVADLVGKLAQLEVIDGVATDQGHVLLGKIAFADRAASAASAAALWIDDGTDNYAGVTWSGIPQADGRHLFLGWMSNWKYAQKVPTERWRSSMTLPRELKLIRTGRGLEVHSMPVVELQKLRVRNAVVSTTKVMREVELTKSLTPNAGLLELHLNLSTHDAGTIELAFRNSNHDETIFRINQQQQRYELDRSASGRVDFDHAFAALQTAPMVGKGDKISLQIYLDRSSIEIFINQGETVISALVFPQTPYDSIAMSADKEVTVQSGMVYELKSIWPKQP
jgi:sucrose-6-phosphate hydrolase SacC (GH32 family)